MKWTDNQTTCTLLSDLQCISSLWDEGWCLCLMPLDCLPCTSLWQTDQRTLTAVLRVDGKVHQLLSGGDIVGGRQGGIVVVAASPKTGADSTQTSATSVPLHSGTAIQTNTTQYNSTNTDSTWTFAAFLPQHHGITMDRGDVCPHKSNQTFLNPE